MTEEYWNPNGKTPRTIRAILAICCATLLAIGCGRFHAKTRCCLLPYQKSNAEIVQDDPVVVHRPDLILSVDERVASITLSHDSKRMILETLLEDEPENNEGKLAESYGVEIWNIEFTEARPEAFTQATPYLVASDLGSAAFDEDGGRIFWTGQETPRTLARAYDARSDYEVVRGADAIAQELDQLEAQRPVYVARAAEETSFPQPLFFDGSSNSSPNLPELTSEPYYVELPDTTSATPSEQTPSQESHVAATPETDASPIWNSSYGKRALENVVLTKPFDSDQYIMGAQAIGKKVDLSAKRMKIADETRYADSVRFSPNARWIICEAFNEEQYQFITLAEAQEAAKDESDAAVQSANTEGADAKEKTPSVEPEPFEKNWAIIPLRDRKRVVRFPETIKMTFDSSTSDEEILGRVVDVLDVSDQGDLVATLVEELPANAATGSTSGSGANGALRYKIVIWDLLVAKTVEFEKAKLPLRALEVAQIAIPYPVERRFCKFSPSGKTFAARVEPKCVSLWQSASGRPISLLGDHSGIVRSFAFAPGETKMIVGIGGKRAQLTLWEIRKEAIYRTLEDDAYDAKSIDAVAFSNDERYVYYANDVGEIKRWNTRPIFANN